MIFSKRLLELLTSLFRNEANKAALHRGPRVKVQLLGEKLTDTIEKAQQDDHVASKPTDATLVESAPRTSGAPSLSNH